MITIPAANLIGPPISSLLLGMDDTLGLRAWQWMFITEAIPTVLLGLACLFWLSEKPETARWLAPSEGNWLAPSRSEQPLGAKAPACPSDRSCPIER